MVEHYHYDIVESAVHADRSSNSLSFSAVLIWPAGKGLTALAALSIGRFLHSFALSTHHLPI
jgi:hypothetical protein